MTYEKAEMELYVFGVDDILATSGNDRDFNDNIWVGDENEEGDF